MAAATMMVTRRQASPEEIAEIWKEFKADPKNQELRNRLVEQYLPLVKYNGERIWSRLPDGVELDDLISAGVFGLMDAIDAFDLTRGVKFETYCVPRIRGAMLDELRTMDWVPRLVRTKASKLNEALKTLEARLGRSPTENELAEQMQISVGRVRKDDDRRQRGEPDQPQQEVVRDRQLQGRPRDRHSRRQEGRRPDAADPEDRPDAAGDQGPESQRAADHHPLLLRRADDEGDRRDARSLGKPREPDAQLDRAAVAGPAWEAAAGVWGYCLALGVGWREEATLGFRRGLMDG